MFLAAEAAVAEAAVAEAAVVEAAVAEAAAVETVLDSVEVSRLDAGLAARAVRVEPVMGVPHLKLVTA